MTRVTVAAIWFYQGGWCKLIAVHQDQVLIVANSLDFKLAAARTLLAFIGAFEVVLGCLVLCTRPTNALAAVQTALLLGMNLSGLVGSGNLIHDPIGMLLNNSLLVAVVWLLAARNEHDYAR